MKIALAQIEVVAGRPDKNTAKMLSFIKQAKKLRADLIAFPEMCIGGYFLGDRLLEDSFCLELMSYNDEIIKASNGIAIAFGNVFLDSKADSRHPNKDGRARRFNAVYVAQDGKLARRRNENGVLPAGIQPKTLLPNYRFFDDNRYFLSLQDAANDYGVSIESLLQPFVIRLGGKDIKIGFELCEDLWCEDYRKNCEALNPTRILTKNKAELIINLSCSPWTYGKADSRDRRVESICAGKDSVPFIYVNCVGAQNNGKNILTFDGGSVVYDRKGKHILFSKSPYKEELIVFDEFNSKEKRREERPKIEQKYSAILQGIKHMDDIIGREVTYIVGMSGGVDSSIVAALLVKAVGKKRVIGVNMPTRFNIKTRKIAQNVAKKLGIEFLTIDINSLVKENERALGIKLNALCKENIQAKIRGTSVLSNIAAAKGALFTNNGNKIEIATGYATLYGDTGGAIAPIGDLTKVEVFDMARFINKIFNKKIIPDELLPDELFRFQIAPSAELREGQIDPFKWGYHDALVEAFTDFHKKTPAEIIKWYIKGSLHTHLGISKELMKRWGIDKPDVFVKDLEEFYSRIQRNVFKRIQAPPIIVLSRSAYGSDIRESQLPFSFEFGQLAATVRKLKRYPG